MRCIFIFRIFDSNQTHSKMPQSLVNNYLHIVFSTKNRQPFIDKAIQNELYRYIGGTCKELESHALIIGGVSDHIHMLVSLSRKIALMSFVEKVKSHSSGWIKTKYAKYAGFGWQRGYGAFSVSKKQIDRVIKYIETQEEHHNKKCFKEEYRTFLDTYNIGYDERYVWD